jgi:hypothetical protein
VSTVLRPIGPHEPRVYWIRRGIVLAVPLIIILLLATTCGGGGGGGGKKKSGGGATPVITPSNTPTKTVVPACTTTQLKLTLTTDTEQYTPGQAPQLIGTFKNADGPTCKLARSADDEDWTIQSGTPTVWTTHGCSSSDTSIPKSIKITAGGSKIVKTTWDGKLRTSDCTESDVAQPGTYTLHATLDGVAAASPHVFHIISSTTG